MKQITMQHLNQSALHAVVAAVTMLTVLMAGFFMFEPSISHGQAGPGPYDFTIKQTITGESSFLVPPANVVTNGSISGLTGGNASGTSEFSIISNSTTGYTVSISYFDNSTPNTMVGDVSTSEAIKDYFATGGEPTYGYNASTSAQFAYTVSSVTPSDTDNSFLNSGAACNTGSTANGTTKATKCWMEPRVSAFQIVDRNSAAPSGATSTIEFDITVPSSAVPVPEAETYTATATLTLLTQ